MAKSQLPVVMDKFSSSDTTSWFTNNIDQDKHNW